MRACVPTSDGLAEPPSSSQVQGPAAMLGIKGSHCSPPGGKQEARSCLGLRGSASLLVCIRVAGSTRDKSAVSPYPLVNSHLNLLSVPSSPNTV